jgi:microcystin-dependent protein
VTLQQSQMPNHTHGYHVSKTLASVNTPANNALAKQASSSLYADNSTPLAQASAAAVGMSGGNQPHNNMMPFLTLNWIIALQGLYPQRP